MTNQQLDATKRLAERYNSTLEHTDVHHSPLGLPKGWITVNICKPEQGKAPHLCNTVVIQAGISPEGSIHT